MTRIKQRVWVCSIATVVSVLGTRIWVENAATVQMLAYSGMVLGLMAIGFREDRWRKGFWWSVLLACALHAALLYAAASVLPFRTTFLLWIGAGLESTLLGMMLVFLLGRSPRLLVERRPGQPRPVEALRRRAISAAGGRVGR